MVDHECAGRLAVRSSQVTEGQRAVAVRRLKESHGVVRRKGLVVADGDVHISVTGDPDLRDVGGARDGVGVRNHHLGGFEGETGTIGDGIGVHRVGQLVDNVQHRTGRVILGRPERTVSRPVSGGDGERVTLVEFARGFVDGVQSHHVRAQVWRQHKSTGRVEEDLVRMRRILAVWDGARPGQRIFERLQRRGLGRDGQGKRRDR